MIGEVRLGGLWDWITGKGRQQPEQSPPPALDVYVPPPPVEPVVFADPAVESLCRDVGASAAVQRSCAGLTVAQSQSGLAGIALELVRRGANDDERSHLAGGALKALEARGVPGPWAFGRQLCQVAPYASQRVAIGQQVLASDAAATGLAGLGLACTRAIDSRYHSDVVAGVGAAALGQLDTPAARLALKLGSAASYDSQRALIYQAFLASPEGTLSTLALQSCQSVDARYHSESRANLGRTALANVDVPLGSLALAMGQAVRYDSQRFPMYEVALAHPELPAGPQGVLQQGVAMLSGIDTRYHSDGRARASEVLLARLKTYPETETLADLALLMMGHVSYDSQRVQLADTVFQAMQAPQSSELGVAQAALATINERYHSGDASAVAMAVLQRTNSGDANLVLEAMKAVSYDSQRVAMSKVLFSHLLAPEPPPFSHLARELLGSLDARYHSDDVVAVGKILGSRYSNPRARALLDEALSRQYASQQAAGLKEAFQGIQGIDDDVTEIKKMARAITGDGPQAAIVEKKGAVLVGGVRLRVRRDDCESAS